MSVARSRPIGMQCKRRKGKSSQPYQRCKWVCSTWYDGQDAPLSLLAFWLCRLRAASGCSEIWRFIALSERRRANVEMRDVANVTVEDQRGLRTFWNAQEVADLRICCFVNATFSLRRLRGAEVAIIQGL